MKLKIAFERVNDARHKNKDDIKNCFLYNINNPVKNKHEYIDSEYIVEKNTNDGLKIYKKIANSAILFDSLSSQKRYFRDITDIIYEI